MVVSPKTIYLINIRRGKTVILLLLRVPNRTSFFESWDRFSNRSLKLSQSVQVFTLFNNRIQFRSAKVEMSDSTV